MGGGAARERERRKRTQQTTLLIHHLRQHPALFHESTLKARSPDPWYMAHTDDLQSNYSNIIFWLVSLLEVIFLSFSPVLQKAHKIKCSPGKASVHCKDHLPSAKGRDFPSAPGGSMGSWHSFKMEIADYFNSFSGLEKS